MINITFPDGSVKPFEKGVTAYEIAGSISPRLAAEVLAATVNGEAYDLARPIEEDAEVVLHKWEDDEAKHVFWHSSAHLMAEALESLYPGVKFGVGPALENGFYYDVDLGGNQITDSDLPRIEQKMLELARPTAPFIFADAGPGCVRGTCPEGKMTCGKMKEVQAKYAAWKEQEG